jgi:hypothetical protein
MRMVVTSSWRAWLILLSVDACAQRRARQRPRRTRARNPGAALCRRARAPCSSSTGAPSRAAWPAARGARPCSGCARVGAPRASAPARARLRRRRSPARGRAAAQARHPARSFSRAAGGCARARAASRLGSRCEPSWAAGRRRRAPDVGQRAQLAALLVVVAAAQRRAAALDGVQERVLRGQPGCQTRSQQPPVRQRARRAAHARGAAGAAPAGPPGAAPRRSARWSRRRSARSGRSGPAACAGARAAARATRPGPSCAPPWALPWRGRRAARRVAARCGRPRRYRGMPAGRVVSCPAVAGTFE